MGCGASTDSFGENALYLAVEKGDADAVRGYIGKGVNVNWKHPSVRAPPPPRAYHGERGPSPPRAPLPAARALGRETTSFAIGALVQRAACPRRRGGHGGPGVAKTHFPPSRAPARRVGARSGGTFAASGARVGARAPFPRFAHARDAAAREIGGARGSSAEERN